MIKSKMFLRGVWCPFYRPPVYLDWAPCALNKFTYQKMFPRKNWCLKDVWIKIEKVFKKYKIFIKQTCLLFNIKPRLKVP